VAPADVSAAHRVAVVGGGLSGLATAHRLVELARRDDRTAAVTVFEASDRLGGAVGTERHGDYLVECGGDMFISDKPWGVQLCERLGLADRLISPEERYRRSLVLHRGKPVPVPEGFMLMAPSNWWAFARSPLLSWRGKLRAAMDLVLPRGDASHDESLASWVRRRFGHEMLERLVQPMVGGIYTADPEKLSLRSTLERFISMEQKHRSVALAMLRARKAREASVDNNASGARYGLFVSFPDGMAELIDAITKAIADVEVRTEARITRLQPQNDGIALECGGERESYDAVVLAVPAYAASALAKETSSQLSSLLAAIPYASSAVVVSGHRLADFGHPLDAFGMVVPAIEQRDVLAVSFASRKFEGRAPDGCVQLRTFVGGALQPEKLDQSDEALIATVMRELRDIFGLRGEPELALVRRHMRAMPQYHVGHDERLAAIDAELTHHPRLALAGNAYRGVGIPDCIHSGEQAAESIWEALTTS